MPHPTVPPTRQQPEATASCREGRLIRFSDSEGSLAACQALRIDTLNIISCCGPASPGQEMVRSVDMVFPGRKVLLGLEPICQRSNRPSASSRAARFRRTSAHARAACSARRVESAHRLKKDIIAELQAALCAWYFYRFENAACGRPLPWRRLHCLAFRIIGILSGTAWRRARRAACAALGRCAFVSRARLLIFIFMASLKLIELVV